MAVATVPSDGTPTVAAAYVLVALAVLILFNRLGFGATVKVG